jgi:hypothetical protein
VRALGLALSVLALLACAVAVALFGPIEGDQ